MAIVQIAEIGKLKLPERATELGSLTDPTRQRFAQLLSEIENPAVLAFALLFHSSGKSTGDGDPVQLSIALARRAMERIRIPVEEQRNVNFLIRSARGRKTCG